MGIPDGAHTHGSGGSGLGTAVLMLVGAALAVKVVGPVVAAVGELVHVLLVVVAVLAGAGAAGVVGAVLWRWRHPRLIAARAVRPHCSGCGPLSRPHARSIARLSSPPSCTCTLHGVSAEDVAPADPVNLHGFGAAPYQPGNAGDARRALD
jgi:hypothetical protein